MYCGLVHWTLILAGTAFFHIYVNSGCKRLNDRMATHLTKEGQLNLNLHCIDGEIEK